MTTVRAAVKDFLRALLKDVKVGVVSFASTSGVDVKPTTDRAAVQKAVDGSAPGETALYEGVQDAVKGLGTVGERSIILLRRRGHRREPEGRGRPRGGPAQGSRRRADQRQGAGRGRRLQERGVQRRGAPAVRHRRWRLRGHRRQPPAVAAAFDDAARTLESQVSFTARPGGPHRRPAHRGQGRRVGVALHGDCSLDLGATALIVASTDDESDRACPDPARAITPLTTKASGGLPAAGRPGPVPRRLPPRGRRLAPVFRSERKERIATIEAYGLGRARPEGKAAKAPERHQPVSRRHGRAVHVRAESTSRTMMRSTVPTSRGGPASGSSFACSRSSSADSSDTSCWWLATRGIGLTLGVVAGSSSRRSCCATWPAASGLRVRAP